MKIAYLTGEYPRATDTFIQREVAGLRHQGADVITCSVRKTSSLHHVGPEQREEFSRTFYVVAACKNPLRLLGAHFRTLAASPMRYLKSIGLAAKTSAPGFKGGLFQLFYFIEAGLLADHLRRNNITHLHNHFANSSCSVAMLASSLSGVPYSVMMHGPAIFFEPMKWRIDEKIARARFVACISHFCRSQGMIFAHQKHWNRMHIVHCGVEPARYQGARTESADGKVRLLFVGRLAAVKGLPMVIDAVEMLSAQGVPLHLTLIGDGSERAALERDVAERGLSDHIHFAGYKSQDEVAAALRNTDVFVLPSFAEGVPVVLMEAMASGVPVIATRVAGVGELVEDGVSGYTVAPGDVSMLADRIRRLAEDGEQRRRFGEAGRHKVAAEYDIASETAWLHDLLVAYHEGRGKELALRPDAPGTDRTLDNPSQDVAFAAAESR